MDTRVLLIKPDIRNPEGLQADLLQQGYVVETIPEGNDLLSVVMAFDPDILVGEFSSPDAPMLDGLRRLEQHHPLPVLMFTRDDDTETINKAVAAGVSAYIVGDVFATRLKPIIDVAIARFHRVQGLQQELGEARAKLDQRKNIERAKGILMQRQGISEEQAYQRMRKVAMDRNLKIAEVADSILTSVDLLN